MANIITAGNSTNGGTQIVTDTSGTLDIKTGTGSGTTAISIDASQNVTITGTISASGGVSGGIRSGTAVASTSGTSIDFTSLPTGIKRITVMLNGVSLNGSSHILVQLGASGVPATTGYVSVSALSIATNQVISVNSTAGFSLYAGNAANAFVGAITFTNVSGNTWVATQGGYVSNFAASGGGGVSLSGVLNIVRITTVNGTDTFDAGTINILYE
jgi:hypothetical protein